MYKTTIHNYSNLSRDNNSSHFHHKVSPRNLYITKKTRYPWGWLLPLLEFPFLRQSTGCPKKHGNSVTISTLLLISIVIPDFASHSIIMSAKVYYVKKVKDCKYVSINVSPR